jgi:hypothetical protein
MITRASCIATSALSFRESSCDGSIQHGSYLECHRLWDRRSYSGDQRKPHYWHSIPLRTGHRFAGPALRAVTAAVREAAH